MSEFERDMNHASIYSQKLTIQNVTLKDRGIYFCNVSDIQQHKEYSKINVTIYGIYFIYC